MHANKVRNMHYVHLENMRVHANVSFCVQIERKIQKTKIVPLIHIFMRLYSFLGGAGGQDFKLK